MQGRAGSTSTSYQSPDPPSPTELWWDHLPSLKIVRPPKGPFSPQVDEICFTLCYQSITGRIHGADPRCRSICLRRVFHHEVSRVLAHHRSQTVTHLPGKKPVVETREDVGSDSVNHPLPPEGQRYSSWLAMLLGDSARNGADPDGAHAHRPEHPDRELRYWQEGWYLWWSTSRWAAQEKLDGMRRDLAGQTEWQHLKEKQNDEWARGVSPFHDQHSQCQDGHHEGDGPTQGRGPAQPELHPFEDLGNAPPFPDVSSHSVLLPLPMPPTSLPAIASQVAPALAPAGRVLALVRASIETGAQKELWTRIWEKARSDEPRKLAVVAWERVMENFGGEKEDGGSSSGGGGGGKSAS